MYNKVRVNSVNLDSLLEVGKMFFGEQSIFDVVVADDIRESPVQSKIQLARGVVVGVSILISGNCMAWVDTNGILSEIEPDESSSFLCRNLPKSVRDRETLTEWLRNELIAILIGNEEKDSDGEEEE